MDRYLRRSCTAEAISRVLEERRGQSQTEEIQIAQRSHCKMRNSHIEGPDLAENNKKLVSPLEPNLKAHAAFLETSGHQDFLGHRSGTKTEKGSILGCWETSKANSGNERGKNIRILIWRAEGNRENLRGRQARSTYTFNARAFKSIVWGQKLSPVDTRQKDWESNYGPTGSGKECPQYSFWKTRKSGLRTGSGQPWRRHAVPSCATGPCCRQKYQPWHYKYWTTNFQERWRVPELLSLR